MAEDLSVDAAVSLLGAPIEQAPDETQQSEIEASPTEADDISEADEPGDDVEAEPVAEAEAEALDPPPLWDAEDKEWFAQQSPEAQAKILKQEAKRESATSKAKQEAAEARKAAEAQAKQIGDIARKAEEAVSKAEQTFQSRWESVDWVAYAEGVKRGEYSAEDFNLHKTQFEAEQRQITEAQQRAAEAKYAARGAVLQEQAAKLQTLAPALTGEKSAENQQALVQYLKAQGVSAEDFETFNTNASALAMAWKAYQFDKAQQGLKSRPKPLPQKGNVVSSAAPVRTTQQRSVEQIAARLGKSGDVDDAVALIQARRRA